MKHPTNSKSQQHRKFLLMIPLLTVPFLTLTFWALGGGTQTAPFAIENKKQGFNLELPGMIDNQVKELDKLEHYQRSNEDSSRYRKEVSKDPYYQMAFKGSESQDLESGIASSYFSPSTLSTASSFASPNFKETPPSLYSDQQEKLIMERLETLNRTLTENADPTAIQKEPETSSIQVNTGLEKDLDRLDQMMQQMHATSSAPDPEFQQMAELLDKILDIQHPQRVEERLKSQSTGIQNTNSNIQTFSSDQGPTVLERSVSTENNLSSIPPLLQNGFFGLEQNTLTSPKSQSITGVVHEEQILVSGETVKLRLTQESLISGVSVPKDQLVYGVAQLNGDRLKIIIRQIRIADQLIPTNLSVHDADGLEGIRIPGSISQEAFAQTGGQSIQSLGLSTFDNSLEAQATTAGIETAKSLLRKKIKQTSVRLKAGYRIWVTENR